MNSKVIPSDDIWDNIHESTGTDIVNIAMDLRSGNVTLNASMELIADHCIASFNEGVKVGSSLPKWISVKDELPTVHDDVLFCASGYVDIAMLGADGIWYRNGYVLHCIPQYWMYLPKAIDENI